VLRHLGLDRIAEHPLHHLHRGLPLAEPPHRHHPAKLGELLLDPAVHLVRRISTVIFRSTPETASTLVFIALRLPFSIR